MIGPGLLKLSSASSGSLFLRYHYIHDSIYTPDVILRVGKGPPDAIGSQDFSRRYLCDALTSASVRH